MTQDDAAYLHASYHDGEPVQVNQTLEPVRHEELHPVCRLVIEVMELIEAKDAYPKSQVYINLMPIFISAMHRVCRWLEASKMKPKGFDGNVYSRHFLGPMGVDLGRVTYRTLRV